MADLPPQRVIAEAIARAANPGFARWINLVHAAGCCAQPVRLAGTVFAVDRATGDAQLTYSTAGEPEGVLFKACETRRATRCPACAAVYQGDARALVLAGLAGGKGVPESVADHPTVFVTLTAPGFGAVHTASDRACRPGRGRCVHGAPTNCAAIHDHGDPVVGTPLCAGCYDYQGAVAFNAMASQLWDRTTTALRRAVASNLGMAVRPFATEYLVSFVKVVEYQRRGVIHLHALLRLDRRDGDRPNVDVDILSRAARLAVMRAQTASPLHSTDRLRWGRQLDVTPVSSEDRRKAANYLAKYATKSTDEAGILDHRLHDSDIGCLGLPDHMERMVETAWRLGGRRDLGPLKLRTWAHTLGYRGHWLTKSRYWSTTFKALREARYHWQLDHTPTPGPGGNDTLAVGDWSYRGAGYHSDGDAWLAHSAAVGKQRNRRTAWQERP